MQTPKKFLASLLALSLVFFSGSLPLPTFAAYNKTSAQNYLRTHSNNPWSVMGLVALGQTPNVDFLKTFSGSSAIDYAAPILALTAAGQNPKTFAADDLVAKLKTYYQQNQIGDPATVNDDIFGLLALVSAGESTSSQIVTDAKNFILNNQNVNGGWGFAVSGGTDSNITAAAIMALKTAGVSSADEKITKAINYLKTAQNDDGGFTYDPGAAAGSRPSDSSSTAWVLWALNALGIDESLWIKNGNKPSDYLISTQHENGYFEWQAGSGENAFSAVNTAYAVIALEGKTLPLNSLEKSEKSLFPFRIEGSQETICEGRASGPSALDIVKNASALCGFSYHIKNTSFGPYLDKINNDEAAGATGWMYWVNPSSSPDPGFISPSIGAAEYRLNPDDEVLWAFGNFDIKPLNLSLDKTEISASSTAMASVTVEEVGTSSVPVNEADVILGVAQFKTAADGKAALSGPEGFYRIFAQKQGFVRSNKVLLKIGAPASALVNLSVNVLTGQVAGTTTNPSTLNFTVEPDSLDFGSLAAGQSSSRTLKLKNTGLADLKFQSEVTQDHLFRDNLKIDGKLWRQFKKDVTAQTNVEVQASITIPAGTPGGQQTGKLILWASPQN